MYKMRVDFNTKLEKRQHGFIWKILVDLIIAFLLCGRLYGEEKYTEYI